MCVVPVPAHICPPILKDTYVVCKYVKKTLLDMGFNLPVRVCPPILKDIYVVCKYVNMLKRHY
jgi:hypothetical protein